MQKSIYNHQKPFIYLWYDRLFKKYYLGYHSGKNKNYICSSKHMMEQYNQRPEDFKRRILQVGARKKMALLEHRLLRTRYNHFGKRYYNLAYMSKKQYPVLAMTDDMKKRLSIIRKGRKHSEETKRKIGLVHKGKKIWNKGLKLSEEHRRKIGLAHKGRKHSEEYRRNCSIAQKRTRLLRKLNLQVS